MGMTAFALDALIKLDDKQFNQSLSNAEGKMSGFGEKMGKIGAGIAKVGAIAGAAATAMAAFTGKIVMGAVNAYASYEQLAGGVETLFGTGGKTLEEYQKSIGITEKSTEKQINKSIEDYNKLVSAQNMVMENAHQAFKTTGMSANEYMETVTQFSASLLQSMKGDTEAAAKAADQAMIDMADNANKMGTDMSAIQNAYAGFAKQNYTMLDNLKLGYGGTQAEMNRLLRDAEKIQKKQGKNVKYNINNLADVYEAIHVVQTEMGITGTTAKEASTTIQGSTQMMKAAWENLKVAMVDPDADIGQAITDLTDSVKTAAANWIPAIKQGLSGLGSVISELAPIISAELPGLINDVLPGLLGAADSLIKGLMDALIAATPTLIDSIVTIAKTICQAIIDNIPVFTQGFDQLLTAIVSAIADNPGQLVDGAVAIITGLVSSITNNLPKVVDAATGILLALVNAITENAPTLIKSGFEIISQLAISIGENLPTLIPAAVDMILEIVNALVQPENVKLLVTGAIAIITGLANGLAKAIPSLAEKAPEIIQTLVTGILENLPALLKALIQAVIAVGTALVNSIGPLLEKGWEAIKEIALAAWEALKESAKLIWEAVSGVITSAIDSASTLLSGIWNTIKSAAESAWNWIKTTAETIWKDISGFITGAIEAASTLLNGIWETIKTTAESVWNGIKATADAVWKAISGFITGAIEAASTFLNGVWTTIKTTAESVWNGIKTTAEKIWNAIRGFIEDPINAAKAVLEKVWGAIKEAAVSAWGAVRDTIKPIIDAIVGFIGGVISTIKDCIEWFKNLIEWAKKAGEQTGRNIQVAGENTFGDDWTAEDAMNYEKYGTIPDYSVSDTSNDAWDAKGDWNVPFDNYKATLHRGEMVLTASQARKYRNGEGQAMDARQVAAIVGVEVKRALSNVGIYMGADRVADLTADRMNDNISALSYAVLHGMGAD